MKQYYCNPINVNYRYQFNKSAQSGGRLEIAREAADPSLILFANRYYMFASMTLGVWVSDDLVHWEYHSLPKNLPLYDYAPDVCVVGEYVYFSASKKGETCNFYRTKDVLNGPYEEITGTFEFWDPHLFQDDDGKLYFYWGCSNTDPMWGVELEQETMKPIGEKRELITGNPFAKGFERVGEDNTIFPISGEELDQAVQSFLKANGSNPEDIPPSMMDMIKGFVSKAPYIEGPWMNKYEGKYYLQYAFAGTQYNTYGDGVYEANHPLGPYKLATNNPYSYKPGGFLSGAGHGSTLRDRFQNLWHSSTIRISMNHNFERRVGIWPAGFDQDGELFCNQRYGDWPTCIKQSQMDPWKNPEWFLLSYKKKVTASSWELGKEPEKVADENIQTWWRATSSNSCEWILMDLDKIKDVRAIQINFADDGIDMPVPGTIQGTTQARYIEENTHPTRWMLEGSVDGENFFLLKDNSKAHTDLPHDFLIWEDGKQVRYVRLTILEIPYQQKPCISGLRIFGLGEGVAPQIPEFTALRRGNIDMDVTIKGSNTIGYNILWGHSPEKLYHSCMVFDTKRTISALVKDREYYVRVDAFNEAGITEGIAVKLVDLL